MFTFFHRRKKIVVDCFTTDSFAYKYAPIVRGPKAFPDWWKKLPANDPNDDDFAKANQNMKKCYGFLEIFKRSLVLPCWTDLRFKVSSNDGYAWNASSGPDPVEHDRSQYEGGFTNYYHSKLTSPWFFKESSGAHFLFTPATWNLENYDFLMPPGIVEYGINHSTNVNILMPKRKVDYSFFIPVGKPLVHIIPLREDTKFEIKNHLVSEDELNKITPRASTLRGIFPLLDMKKKQSKCPFGFS